MLGPARVGRARICRWLRSAWPPTRTSATLPHPRLGEAERSLRLARCCGRPARSVGSTPPVTAADRGARRRRGRPCRIPCPVRRLRRAPSGRWTAAAAPGRVDARARPRRCRPRRHDPVTATTMRWSRLAPPSSSRRCPTPVARPDVARARPVGVRRRADRPPRDAATPGRAMCGRTRVSSPNWAATSSVTR